MAFGFLQGRRELHKAQDELAEVIEEITPAHSMLGPVRHPKRFLQEYVLIDDANVNTEAIDGLIPETQKAVIEAIDRSGLPGSYSEQVRGKYTQQARMDRAMISLGGSDNFSGRIDVLQRLGLDETAAAVVAHGVHPGTVEGRRLSDEYGRPLEDFKRDLDDAVDRLSDKYKDF